MKNIAYSPFYRHPPLCNYAKFSNPSSDVSKIEKSQFKPPTQILEYLKETATLMTKCVQKHGKKDLNGKAIG